MNHPLKTNTIRFDMLVIGGLLVPVLCLFWRTLATPDQIVYGVKALTSDITVNYTLETVVREALARGEMPLWNPYYGAGMPLLADFRASVLYPFSVLFRLLPISIAAAFNWDGVLHVWLAGVGMYVFLRDLGTGRPAAALSAVSIMFSGTLPPRFLAGHVLVVHALAWEGWLLFAYRRLLLTRSWWPVVATAVFTAVTLVARVHPQSMMIMLAIPACMFGFYAARWAGSGRWRDVGAAVGGTVLAGVLAAGLSAGQILPTLEAFGQSVRTGGFSYEAATDLTVQPAQLVTMVVPHLWFNVATTTTLGFGYFFEESIYAGLFTLVLAVAAVFGPDGDRRLFARFLLIPALIGLGLAVPNSPLFWVVYKVMPFIRYSGRFAQIWVFCMAILGGLGLEAVVQRAGRLDWPIGLRWVSVVVGGLSLVATVAWARWGEAATDFVQARGYFDYVDTGTFAGAQLHNLVALTVVLGMAAGLVWLGSGKRLPVGVWAWMVVGGLAIELALYAWPLVAPHDVADLYSPANPLAVLDLDASEVRVESGGSSPAAYLVPTVVERREFELARVAAIRNLGMNGGRGSQLLAAGSIVSSRPINEPGLHVVRHTGEAYLYAYADMLPRIYAAPAVRVEEALDFVASEEFEPFETAVVVTEGREAPGLPRSAEGGADVAAEMLEYTPKGLRARVEADVPVMVVFSEIYYPGWEGWVDGEAVPVWRANYAFRGVEVGAGTHVIEMKYHPASFRLGAMISGVTLALMGLISLGAFGQRVRAGRGDGVRESQ